MLNICFIIFVIFLCVLGIYQFIKEITAILFRNDIKSTVILEISDNANSTEYALRSVLYANPQSEIIIVDNSKNEETKKILSKFAQENMHVHIKTAPEK